MAYLWLLLVAPASGWFLKEPVIFSRRAACLALSTAIVPPVLLSPLPASALIKGSTPPSKSKPKERKCSNIDECEALGAQRGAEIDAASGINEGFERTAGGDRYRDLTVGDGRSLEAGDAAEVRYRVMRLGTKARDGLSGEGQTIFSFGFGEDEDQDGDVLPVRLSGETLVPGVESALVGMKPGGRRRVLVRPERGWKDQSSGCADIVFKADIGASVENEASCLTKTKLPQPRSYGAKARMARRFDESLLVELDYVNAKAK